jgi:HD-GYP domain-containing protein (c-di-GMP phosphodiesterase class II)
VRDIVKHHHERIDGNGYPDNLMGDEIHYLVQIVAIADVYDALTTDRPYRKALSREEALSYLKEKGGQIIEIGLLRKFISYVRMNEIIVKHEELNSIWNIIISEFFRVTDINETADMRGQ